MSQQKAVVILLLNVFLTSFVCARHGHHRHYGSPADNSNLEYGGTGTSVPSEGYGHKGQNPIGGPGGSDGNSEAEPFKFAYQVKDALTNTYFMHEANSDGKQVTGAYSVLLPDGRNQVVTYVANDNGYNAKVNYEEGAKPQPSQPDSLRGYPSRSGFPSTASKYPFPTIASFVHRPAGYPVHMSTPAPLSASGYLVRLPPRLKGDTGSSRPNFEEDTDYPTLG